MRSWVLDRGYADFREFTLPAVACIACSRAVSLRPPQPQGVDQGLQVRHLKVRLCLRWRGSPEAPLGRSSVDPGGIETHPLGRHVVVEEALGHVQYLLGRHPDPLQGQLEVVRRGLVGPGLLGGDDVVELHLQVPGRQGEQAVVYVGDDRQLVPALESAQGVHRVGERQPVAHGVGKRLHLRRAWLETPPPARLANLFAEHVAVLDVAAPLGGGLQLVLGLGVQIEYLVVRGLDTVAAQDGPEARDYPALPIHERPVAVEREDLVLVRVQQSSSSSGVGWFVLSCGPNFRWATRLWQRRDNFSELRQSEVRRICLPGTSVNKGKRKGQYEVSRPSLMASALRRLVGEIENARAEGLRVDELQRPLIAPFLKQTLSAPHDDRMNHEPELVEEVVFKQRPNQGRAAGDGDVLTFLLL